MSTALLVQLAACAAAPLDRAAPAPAALAAAEVRGIEEGGFDPRSPVRLAGGAWEGAPFVADGAARPRLLLLDAPQAEGDLDGDGAAERVALLSASSGGSGERIYLAAFGARGGQAVQRAGVLVGDRVKPRALALEGDSVVLDVVETGPGQPLCCGTQLARLRYRLDGDTLRQTAHEVQGELALAAAAGEWRLLEQDGAAVPAGVDAPTLVIADGAVYGFGGCNRYRGTLREVAPGEFAPGPHGIAATRMACPGPQSALEDAFLGALGHARRFGFAAGRLHIDWEDGERRGALVFAR